MNTNHRAASHAAAFFKNRGFYIILFLLVGAIGVSGYVLFFGEDAAEEDYLLSELPYEDGLFPSEDMTDALSPEDTAADNKTTEVPVSGEQGDKEEQTVPVNNPVPMPDKPKAPFFVRPVAGDILKPFSENKLVFDETMDDWRVHNGTDFYALDGERVCAVADGTVTNVWFDRMDGYCIEIEHADGLKSRYTGLMKKAVVDTGDEVKAGDVIGGVGSSMLRESKEEMHLHLELIQDGEYIDPMSCLPES